MTGAARDHALPVEADRLVEMLREEGFLAPEVEARFAAVARRVAALFHHEFFAVKQRMRRAWSGLEEGASGGVALRDGQRALARDLLQTLRRLLRRANFVPVPVEEILEAMKRHGSFGLSIELDLADFEELEAWRRRVERRRRQVPALFGFGRRSVEIEFFDRFCLYARFKGPQHFEAAKDGGKPLGIVPGGVALRLFRDVPRHDVEALFPGVRVRMRWFDRALIGVPAAAGVLHFLVFKIGTSLGAIFLALLVFVGLRKEEPEVQARALGACAGLAVLLAFLFRQWMRFLGRKNLLHRQLAEHLQSCTLDAGPGVLLHLLDEAEEEETAEAVLAYAFLLRAGRPIALAELDREVEEFVARRLGFEVEFEEEDALEKLERFGLVARGEGGAVAAVAPREALERLEERWRSLAGGA
jgi:hypothetical protein